MNIKAYLGLSSDTCLAPTAEEFAKFWAGIRKGQSAAQGCDDVGTAHKIEKMSRCLWQGMMELDHRFLGQEGVVIALHRDESKQKVNIRFSAADNKLQERRGGLGLAINPGGSLGINEATKKIFADFGTPKMRKGVITRGSTSTQAPTCDLKLMKNIQESTELINTDAAADEIRASTLGQKRSVTAGALTPNAKHIARDKAHAARKTPLCKRTCMCVCL